MGALAQKIQHEFDSIIRQRGREYYVSGAVHIGTFNDSTVRARVTGEQSYHVSLELKISNGEGWLKGSCSCPFYRDRGACKHLWATILEADIQRKLQPPPTVALLRLELNHEFDAASGAKDDDDLDDEDDGPLDRERVALGRASAGFKASSKDPEWKQFVTGMNRALATTAAGSLAGKAAAGGNASAANGESMYTINVPETLLGNGMVMDLFFRDRKKSGDWGVPKVRGVERNAIHTLPNALDRQACNLLLGGEANRGYATYYVKERNARFTLNPDIQEALLPPLAKAGRLFMVTREYGQQVNVQFDEGAPWIFHLELNRDSQRKEYVLSGSLRRGDERAELSKPVILIADQWIFWNDRLSRLNDSGAFPLIGALRKEKEIRVPLNQGAEFVAMLQRLPRLPPFDAPQELRVEEVHATPSPCLRIKKPMYDPRGDLRGELSFDYNGATILGSAVERGVFHPTEKKLYVRDVAAENAAHERMMALGFRVTRASATGEPELAPRHLPRVVAKLIAEKWRVEADGKLYRTPGEMKMTVASGIDWFELRAEVDFGGGATATLPALLAALRKGETLVRLDDGSFG